MNARLKLPKQTQLGGRGRYRVPLPPFAWYRQGPSANYKLSLVKFLLWAFFGLLAILVLLYAFRRPLLISVGEALVYESELQTADVIVVLGGGETLRAEHAAKLYREYYASRIFVLLPKTIANDVPYRDLSLIEQHLVEAVFDLHQIPPRAVEWSERPVFSTYEETLLIKQWTESNDVKSILVVAGYFQSSRAQWVFERALADRGIRVQVVPAPEPDISVDNWWTDVDGILDVQNEYIKYSYYRVRGLLGRE